MQNGEVKRTMKPRWTSIALCIASTIASTAHAQFTMTGLPVPELDWADTNLRNFIINNEITAGLLAISRNGVIVYQRGCGYLNEDLTVTIPENALVRIASCTKPFTGAAIQQLATAGNFNLGSNAFNLGQTGGGVLDITAFDGLGDSRLRNVTVGHLLQHMGGWNRGTVGDWTYEECQIAGDMGVNSPPGRTNTMRWILGQPLQFAPGTNSAYSNIGYLACGLIVEQESGLSLISYLRQHVLTPNMWVPSTDLRQGRTFRDDQPVREAWYDSGLDWCVFQGECAPLRCSVLSDSAYGGWDHEARIGQGGLVVSAATMLQLANRYYVGSGSASIGAPVDPSWSGAHGGALDGVNCRIWQRGDGTNVFIWFNKKNDDEDGTNFASQFATQIDDELDAQTNWPTRAVDGFWVQLGTVGIGQLGSYNHPFQSMQFALTQLASGSRVNLKPGSEPTMTGTINTKLMLRAPQGAARLGG